MFVAVQELRVLRRGTCKLAETLSQSLGMQPRLSEHCMSVEDAGQGYSEYSAAVEHLSMAGQLSQVSLWKAAAG